MSSSENVSNPLTHYEFHGHQVAHPDSPLYRMVIEEVFSGQAYPLERLGSFIPTVIFDVGANVGTTAIYFRHHFPEAEIHCYEPDPFNLQLLTQNTSGMGKITIHPFGLQHENAELPLYQGPHGSAENSLFCETGPHKIVTIRRASEAVMETGVPQISILKIDTEGAEPFIILDLFNSNILKIPIGAIFLELHAQKHQEWIDNYLSESYTPFQLSTPRPHRTTRLYVLNPLLPLINAPTP